MTISSWLQIASAQLRSAGIPSVQLDAELLLGYALKKPREYVLAHPEGLITQDDILTLNKSLKRRINREPLAYILGEKEFYGRIFRVNKRVLIPRPESEVIIDLLKDIDSKPGTIIDIGTGSGCLAITAKLELPRSQVIASDINPKALALARVNAEHFGADIEFIQRSLLEKINPSGNTVIIANLPYVDRAWETSPEIAYEPPGALFADDSGLALITQLIIQAENFLQSKNYLILEADQRQHKPIIGFAHSHNFKLSETKGLILVFARVQLRGDIEPRLPRP